MANINVLKDDKTVVDVTTSKPEPDGHGNLTATQTTTREIGIRSGIRTHPASKQYREGWDRIDWGK